MKTAGLARTAALALAAGALAGGCGAKAEGEGGEGPKFPTGANEVVLQVFSGGGYVPQIDALREYPEAVLYGDGRLVTPVETPGIDTPVRPRLEVRLLSDEQMATVLDAAVDAGLDEPLADYGNPEITDLATTTFTLRTDDGTSEASVYALGHDDGVAAPAEEAREELAALAEGLADPDSLLGDDAPVPAPFQPEAWLVSPVADPDECERVEGEFPRDVAREGGRVAVRPAIGLEDRCPAEDEGG